MRSETIRTQIPYSLLMDFGFPLRQWEQLKDSEYKSHYTFLKHPSSLSLENRF